jgi:hypothetical protein
MLWKIGWRIMGAKLNNNLKCILDFFYFCYFFVQNNAHVPNIIFPTFLYFLVASFFYCNESFFYILPNIIQ